MNRATLILPAVLLLAACGKSESSPPAGATASASGATNLATPEDYEATATRTVTADTIDARLDALEKEIAATPK